MGYGTTRFQKSVDANLICGICSGVLENPVLTPCGHSFCAECVNTWLRRPEVNTCPECRTHIEEHSTKPILSLRNLIQSMEVSCENEERGCTEVIVLEKQEAHLQSCAFSVTTCAGCGLEMNRFQSTLHQMECMDFRAILDSVRDDSEDDIQEGDNIASDLIQRESREIIRSPMTPHHLSRTSSDVSSVSQVIRLLTRIGSLEKQVGRLLDSLNEAHANNSYLYMQHRQVQEELDIERRKYSYTPCFRFDYEDQDRSDFMETYNNPIIPVPQDVARLSLLIARYLLQKPKNIDSDDVFHAVRTCYKSRFSSMASDDDHDVHMLLATAFASNWFTPVQRVTLGCWLQCVLRCQGCRRMVEG